MRKNLFGICFLASGVLFSFSPAWGQETGAAGRSEDEMIFRELESGVNNGTEVPSVNLEIRNDPYGFSMTKPADRTVSEFYFTFRADESLFGLRIDIESDRALSLFINHESNEVDLKADTGRTSGRKSVEFSRFASPRLADGLYYGVVVYQSESGIEETVSFRLTLVPVDLSLEGTVSAGQTQQWETGGRGGAAMAYYALELPVSATALRVDIFECDTDVDLYLFAGEPDYRLDHAVLKGETYAGCETVLLDARSKPVFNPNEKYFLLIYDRHPAAVKGRVSFALEAGSDPSYAARRAMTVPVADEDPKKNAVGATVEILCEQSTGTGFVISPKGYILTALHVLKRADGTYSRTVIGAVNTDVRKPAAERFRLKMVASDESRDIALLKIDSMLFGAYPTELATLPSFSLSNRSRAEMGDVLLTLGYPKSGGTASKNSVKMARGIFSGYENRGGIGYIISDIKADAGNSGGPVFDSLYRIVGIAQSLLQSDYSYLLCIYPIDSLPSSWLEMIRDDR